MSYRQPHADERYKPDVTSEDYKAGLRVGQQQGESKARRDVQGKLSRLAREVKEGRHCADALGVLREAWRRIRG